MTDTAEQFLDQKLSALAAYVRGQDADRMSAPAHLGKDVDFLAEADRAGRFKPANWFHSHLVGQAKEKLERDLPGANDRRRYELKLADFIQHKVLPLYGGLDRGLAELPAKLRACRDSGLVGLTPQGDVKHRWPAKCNQSKLCAHEAREEGQRLAERYLQPVAAFLQDNPRAKLQYWVVSPLNVAPGGLHDAKRQLMKIHSRLNRRAVTKAVVGSVVVQEDPVGRDGNWNVHLNVLALVDGHFDWAAYRRAFMDELEHDQIQIEFITEHEMKRRSIAKAERRAKKTGVAMLPINRHGVITDAFVELVKYTTKITGYDHATPAAAKKREAPPMYAWSRSMWFEWYRSNQRFRRTRSYGVLYRVCDTCGSYDHAAAACGDAPESAPQIEWIGAKTWHDFETGYRVHIDLIPAHNSTIQAGADALHIVRTNRTNRGPP